MRLTLCAAAIGVLSATLTATAAEVPESTWPSFRGQNRNAVAPDTGLLTKWPEGGPKLVWKADGAGEGYSSLAVAGGHVYTVGDTLPDAKNTDEYLLCYDQATGKELWKARTGPAYQHRNPQWKSPRSTPTVDGDRVYVFTANAELICFKTADGYELWRKDMRKEFQGKKADGWGFGESPLIDGNKVVCTPGGAKHTMVALDKMTGDTVWTTAWPGVKGAGHASIVVAEVGDARVYVQTTGSGAMGVRADDGKLLWTYDKMPRITAVIPTPIVRGDLVFFTTGYDGGGALLRQVPGADGTVSIEEIYPINSRLKNKHGGVVLVGDYIYADTDSRGTPFCADLMTGEIKWTGRSRAGGKGSASIAAADGHLYIHYQNGTMTLVEANPKKFIETGGFKLPGRGGRPGWSHPVVAGGKLYVREGDTILCYDLRG